MKVALLTPWTSRMAGGMLHAVRRPAQHLHADFGADVHVFGLRDEDTEADLPGWAPLRVSTFLRGRPTSFGYSRAMGMELRRAKADLVHAHALWQYPSVATLRWTRETGRPHMVSPHGMLDSWALRNARWKKIVAGAAFERANLREAACLHALNEKEAASISAYGLSSPICIIPNGCDLPQIHRRTKRASWVQKLEPGRRVLLYLGRIHPKKGLALLLRSWKDVCLARRDPGWDLVIAGWGDAGHMADLEAIVVREGIEESVHFVGPQFDDDKAATYESADAFILPSLSEGQPMVLLEAWAYGLPAVATAECNLPQGFAAGAAIDVRPDAGSIREGLLELFSLTPAQLAEIGARGRALVAESFTWSRAAKEFYSVYRWILGQDVRPDCVVDPGM